MSEILTNEVLPVEVSMQAISKQFPGVLACDHIDLEVRKGEIHALLGENGAGKSTLMNILYGLLEPDTGEILVRNERVRVHSPKQAITLGIGMVHQDFMLVPSLSVIHNVSLGLESTRAPFLDDSLVEDKINELASQYQLSVDPRARVWQLSVGEQQRVEILKALYRNAQVLILDEPTALLTPQESEKLMAIMRVITEGGRSVIFITHKLQEVFRIADRVTVLRDGRVTGTKQIDETNRQELVRMMVGRDVNLDLHKDPLVHGKEILRLEDVKALNKRGLEGLKSISITVREGEILGIAGVEGNGQEELVEVIVGLRRTEQGMVIVDGSDITNWSPSKIHALGIAYVPSDRQNRGSIQSMSLAENMVLEVHNQAPFSRCGFLRPHQITSFAKQLIEEYDIHCPSENISARLLSGGNLQKLILSRELSRNPHLLIVCQPTRGLDIASTHFVRTQLLTQRAKGVGILLVSADLDEILSLSDRIAVIYEGQIVGIVRTEEATVEDIGLMMVGEHISTAAELDNF